MPVAPPVEESRVSDSVELRGMVSRDLIEVLDAIAIARKKARIDVVVEVLQAFADERIHEATLIQRVTRGNPRLMDQSGGASE